MMKEESQEKEKMNCSKINEKLDELYSSVWDKLNEKLCKLNAEVSKEEDKASLPLLLQLDEKEFNKSELKVMYFGQEERPVFGAFSGQTTIQLYDYYKKHNNLKNNKPDTQGSGGEMSEFIKKYYKEKEVYTMHNNVFKISSCNDDKYGKPTKKIKKIIKDKFDVIQKEIEIIKPDAIFIFAKSYYPKETNKYIGNIENPSKIKVVGSYYVIQGALLNIPTVVAYHPSARYGAFEKQKDKITL